LLDKNVERRFPTFGEKDEVPNLAFQTDIRDKAMHILRIGAWRVGGIGITVGIAIHAIEEINEVVAVVHAGCLF
jgi:hypothetical protein